ncbi:type I-B CRISPR-associated protein Cas7/Csh2 [Coprothermobacter platensis]|uniref:type I-B CRISPR-associated protein Cas7/Csh2 n=1 Tax=Coprothermobacter platensis TaxID=108819 RepID=UPI000375441D|nr:type I-B CRISPR-associated protein Cas7/Csh2 [Coprothermobacter platensis]
MSEIGRREILFLYDVIYANPNGDPNDENRPRLDEESGKLYVTDVRLKRTVRDYMKDILGKEIYIYEETDEEGKRITKAARLRQSFNSSPIEAMRHCIDLKLFGATFAIKDKEKENNDKPKGKSKNKAVEENEDTDSDEENEIKEKNLNFTGPVQFRFGRSLHAVKLQNVKGTTVMPKGENKKAGTFTDKWIVPYALIGFEGVVNGITAEKNREFLEKKAKESDGFGLTLEDLDTMYQAMWRGTKELFTTSKAQSPMLLLEVVYNDETYHIGDLERMLTVKTELKHEDIRDTKDYLLDTTDLVNVLKEHADKIRFIRVKQNPILNTAYGDEVKPISDILKEHGFEVQSFSFEG